MDEWVSCVPSPHFVKGGKEKKKKKEIVVQALVGQRESRKETAHGYYSSKKKKKNSFPTPQGQASYWGLTDCSYKWRQCC